MLPLEMVYDYDPTPLPPEYARQALAAGDLGESHDAAGAAPVERRREDADAMSDADQAAEAMSEGEGKALTNFRNVKLAVFDTLLGAYSKVHTAQNSNLRRVDCE